jgi:glucokinase
MAILLAGDVGGTKVRLCLVEAQSFKNDHKCLWQPLYKARYSCSHFPSLVSIITRFLQEAGTELGFPQQPQKACFAVAGPVFDNTCKMTNLGWLLEGSRLESELKVPKIRLINDFAAVCYGLLGLEESDLVSLQTGKLQEGSPIAVLGAGTGLGEAFLIKHNSDHYQPYSTEGSHADFAPRTKEQFRLLEYLQTKLLDSHVSVERVVSGPGILSIYQFLRDSQFAPESEEIKAAIETWEKIPSHLRDDKKDPAPLISKSAIDKRDYLCEETMRIFVEAYGAEAGNLALKLLPFKGLYVAGGITGKIIELIQRGDFLSAFLNKGRMKSLLEKIPVYIVQNDDVGLIGAAVYAMQI